jgi:hypothetical protein
MTPTKPRTPPAWRTPAHRRIAIGKLTAHQMRERSCRRDSFAGSLDAPFQYQGNVADWKSENLNENTACDVVTVGKPQTAEGGKRSAGTMPMLDPKVVGGCVVRSQFFCDQILRPNMPEAVLLHSESEAPHNIDFALMRTR